MDASAADIGPGDSLAVIPAEGCQPTPESIRGGDRREITAFQGLVKNLYGSFSLAGLAGAGDMPADTGPGDSLGGGTDQGTRDGPRA